MSQSFARLLRLQLHTFPKLMLAEVGRAASTFSRR
jgi:hypothetical protein